MSSPYQSSGYTREPILGDGDQIDIIGVTPLPAPPAQQVVDARKLLESVGIWVGTVPPPNPVTYAQWSIGTVGFWAWADTTGF